MKYHPDQNEGDSVAEEKFKEASEAYEILSDTQKKAKYDQYGHQAFGPDAGGFGGGGFHDASDIFEQVFGGMFGGGGGGRRRGGRPVEQTYDMISMLILRRRYWAQAVR